MDHLEENEIERCQSIQNRATVGIPGLDYVLRGGLPQHRLHVVEGSPGSGKTTLALQFQLEGTRRGERSLYVTLSETADELHEVAASHHWSLDGIELLELGALADRLREEAEYTIYHPSDVELGETTKRVRAEVARLSPSRVVLDSVSELKILSQSNARYRREILGLKQFFARRNCTVLLLDDRPSSENERQLQSIAHGVICLERETRAYGETRRQIQILKMRGVRFRDGLHDFKINTGGIEVYPRLSAAEHSTETSYQSAESGNPQLDSLLGAGLDRGSSILVLGPAGSGKTALCSQYAFAALGRGEPVSYLLFEESRRTFLKRSAGLNIDFGPYIKSGLLRLERIDPADLSPGEFAYRVRQTVERHATRMIVIDSLNGYMNALPDEHFLLIQMHELLTYLGQQSLVTMLVMAQHGMLGSLMKSPINVSFVADTVILLRFFEAQGEVRKAISVLKRRQGEHESSIREMRISAGGLQVGEPLRNFEGVLAKIPRFQGRGDALPKLKDEN